MRNKDLSEGSDVDTESKGDLVTLGDLLDESSKGRKCTGSVINFRLGQLWGILELVTMIENI